MNKCFDAFDIADMSSTLNFELQVPDQCPCCHTALSPTHLASFYIANHSFCNTEFGKLFSLYFCPKCEECFMAHYTIQIMGYGYQSHGDLQYLTPYGDAKLHFSERIKVLSPNFVTIYHQSEKAEQMGLSEICGLGYRKSLEFLVKDYAIAFNPDNEDDIKNQMLSPCIKNFIDNKKIKALATASAWIGNDETHYVRKHEDFRIDHLKAFIAAIVSYIDSELSFLQAESLLNNSKNS